MRRFPWSRQPIVEMDVVATDANNVRITFPPALSGAFNGGLFRSLADGPGIRYPDCAAG